MSEEVLKIGTLKRFHLDLSNLGAPTGTPQISIEKQGSVTAANVNMTVRIGTDNEIWYYDYTIPDIAVGQYEAVMSYTVSGDAGRIISEFDIITNNIDDVKTDTEIIITNLDVSTGANAVTLNIKDSVPNPISDVEISFHNANNNATPVFGIRTSNTLGATTTINLNDATYTLRLIKNGVVNETQTIDVEDDELFIITVTPATVTTPSTPGVCRVRLYPSKLGFANVTDADIYVTPSDNLTLISDVFLDNRPKLMTYDVTTTLDSYYVDVIYGARIRFTSSILGMRHTLTVPSQITFNVSSEDWE
jgi:hypothetical protein